MSDRIGPRKVLPLPPVELDAWGDGKLGQAMKFASTLRRQGAREASACDAAARAFGVEAVAVAKALGMRGAVMDLAQRERRGGRR